MNIFDSIRNAFSKTDSERVDPQGAETAAVEPAPQAQVPAADGQDSEERFHVVQSGETLWQIAQQECGDGDRYPEIYAANRDQLQSPDHILPGQKLRIP